MEYMRSEVKRFDRHPNGDCSCDTDFSGQVTDEISQLFDMYPYHNSVILDDEDECFVVNIRK